MSGFSPIVSPVQSGAIGWVTESEMTAYVATRYVANLVWNGLSSGDKSAVLMTAYRDIVTSPYFSFPADTEVTDWIKWAQMEQAIYIAQQKEARDRRMGILAQGVTRSDVAKEFYSKIDDLKRDICASALSMLKTYKIKQGYGAFIPVEPESRD